MHPVVAWKPFSDSPDVASARLRAALPCEYMRAAGWPCEMFDRENVDSYRLVVFQKAYDDESIRLAEALGRRGVKTVFDLCDNHFYNPGGLPDLRERAERLRRMIDVVDAVSVSTPELGKLIEGKDCVVIDDAVEQPRRSAAGAALRGLGERLKNISASRSLRVVWYGNAGSESPAFGLIDVPKVLPHLEALHAQTPVTLTVISNSEELFRKYVSGTSFPTRYVQWKQETFTHVFSRQDLCVIPITANPFTVCKTNNRLVLSLLMGVPVVADEIPSYAEFRDFALFGDWRNSLQAYARDAGLRRRHVSGARRYIRSKYNRGRVVSQWSSLFERLLGPGWGAA